MQINRKVDQAQRAGRQTKLPAYLELASELEEEIRSGRLAPGSRLPAQRDLAKERSVNLSTISRAYRELQNRQLVVSGTRRGTTVMEHDGAVRHGTPVGSPARVIDLTVNRPATRDYLSRLAETLPRIAEDPRFPELQDYQPPEGAAWARAAGVRWIALNGFSRPASDVVVTSGAQHALFAVISSFIEPGDVVAADRLTYYGLKALAQMFRFGIVGLGSDGQGLSAGELDDACKRQRIKAVFTVPTFQNPTVVTMSAERRAEIAEIARRHDLIVIEDDVYGPMPGKRAAAIATLCPERTFHISSLSKALAPGLRVGFLLSPPGRATITAEAIRGTSWMPAPLSVLVATRWIEDGTARRILDAQVAELGARNRITSEMLAGLDFNADPACMFIWLRLPSPWHTQDFAANARAHGVGVMPASAFAVDHQATEQSVRINLGCAASRQELTEALRIIAVTLRDRPRALFTTI